MAKRLPKAVSSRRELRRESKLGMAELTASKEVVITIELNIVSRFCCQSVYGNQRTEYAYVALLEDEENADTLSGWLFATMNIGAINGFFLPPEFLRGSKMGYFIMLIYNKTVRYWGSKSIQKK